MPFEKQTVEAWDAATRVNLTSAFILAQAAKAALERSGKGSIILFSSTYGIVSPDQRMYQGMDISYAAGYAASKGGLLQLMRYLATTLAPTVRVNAISPATMSTFASVGSNAVTATSCSMATSLMQRMTRSPVLARV